MIENNEIYHTYTYIPTGRQTWFNSACELNQKRHLPEIHARTVQQHRCEQTAERFATLQRDQTWPFVSESTIKYSGKELTATRTADSKSGRAHVDHINEERNEQIDCVFHVPYQFHRSNEYDMRKAYTEY